MKQLRCPKNKKHKTFSVMAHVTEEWEVDVNGDFVNRVENGDGEVTHRPSLESNDFCFTCMTCGTTAVIVDTKGKP